MKRIEALLNDLKDWAAGEEPIDSCAQAVNQGMFEMKTRIFNDQKGAKDVKGQGLGGYSNTYAKIRQAKGRQVKVVDFVFDGSLIKDIKIVRNGTQISIAAPSETERKKIGYLEKQYKKDIFNLSKDEKDSMNKRIKLNLDKGFQEIIDGYK